MIKLPEKPRVILREGNRAVFEIDGLYPGYGITIGNALRRILLSSLEGAAITMLKMKGVSHEFSTIPGVMEDTVDLLLNIKQVRLRLFGDEPQKISLKVKGKRDVTAGDIKTPTQVEVVNTDLHVATLTAKNADFDMEMTVEKGFGYVPVEGRKRGGKLEVGTIAVDAIFTPMRKVSYEVENMRVGDRTDYNRLRLHIETDGTISPESALANSLAVLRDQVQAIEEGLAEIKPKVREEKKVLGGGGDSSKKEKKTSLKKKPAAKKAAKKKSKK